MFDYLLKDIETLEEVYQMISIFCQNIIIAKTCLIMSVDSYIYKNNQAMVNNGMSEWINSLIQLNDTRQIPVFIKTLKQLYSICLSLYDKGTFSYKMIRFTGGKHGAMVKYLTSLGFFPPPLKKHRVSKLDEFQSAFLRPDELLDFFTQLLEEILPKKFSNIYQTLLEDILFSVGRIDTPESVMNYFSITNFFVLVEKQKNMVSTDVLRCIFRFIRNE